jgi:hypothetical protein
VNYTASSFTYSQPLTLRSNTGAITVSDILRTGTYGLTITGGIVSLQGVYSGTLAVTGSLINLNSLVTTTGLTGSQTYTGPVVLTNIVQLDTRGSLANEAGSNISFSNTVNTDGGGYAMTINAGAGSVSFGSTVGNTQALLLLSVRSSHATGIT